MATRRAAVKITRGGTKLKPWIRWFIPGDGHPDGPTPKAAKVPKAPRGGAKGPLGSTDTIIPNPANPPLRIIAEDVAVRVGGSPMATPTVAAGQATASAIGAVIADSGAMPAGTYRVELRLSASAVRAAGKQLQVEHRNAANAATVALLHATPGEPVDSEFHRVVLALNERIRVVVGAVAMGAGEIANAQIRMYLLPV